MTVWHSAPGRRAGSPITEWKERWRVVRRWLRFRTPTHMKELP